MGQTLKIAALVVGLSALAILVFFGFAIWVFIPLLPAGIIFVVAMQTLKRRRAAEKSTAADSSDDSEFRKAA